MEIVIKEKEGRFYSSCIFERGLVIAEGERELVSLELMLNKVELIKKRTSKAKLEEAKKDLVKHIRLFPMPKSGNVYYFINYDFSVKIARVKFLAKKTDKIAYMVGFIMCKNTNKSDHLERIRLLVNVSKYL